MILNKFIRKGSHIVVHPFITALPAFVTFLVMALVTPVLLFISDCEKGNPTPLMEMLAWLSTSVVISWGAALIYSWYRKIIILVILLTLFAISAFTDIVCYVSMGSIYSEWIIETVLGTNLGEASEFIFERTSPKPLIIVVLTTWLCIAAFFVTRRIVRKRGYPHSRRYKGWCLGILAVCLLGTTVDFSIDASQAISRTGFLFKTYHLCTIHPAPDIVSSHPKLQSTSSKKPTNIAIIVGESMNRNHCHFAGYSRETTPQLEKLNEDSSLVFFNLAKAADLHTIQCFKRFMSTNSSVGKDSLWYTSPNIIEVGRVAGYHTTWLSNQSKTGVYFNVVSKFGHFCDDQQWLRGETSTSRSRSLDDALIPLLRKYREKNDTLGKNLYFLHLMGSHPSFSQRYPKEFDHFSPEEYTDRPSNQRYDLATYDNSVLFTDYVVSSLMQEFDGTASVVFYFSDHALDIYDTDPTFCEHARPGDAASERVGYAIPFMIYATKEYRQQFPATWARIKNAASRPIDANDLIYTVMDIMGERFADNDDVARKSFIK